MAGFFFTGDEASTPEAIDRKRQLINALAKDNLSSAPVGHWTQALARVLGAGADQYETSNLNKTEKVETEKNKNAFNDYYASILGGASPPALNAGAALPASQPAPATPAVQGEPSAVGNGQPVNVPPGAPPGTPQIVANGGQSAVPIAQALLRKFEGFRATPYSDVNALRAGYGSDTITNPDGSVQPVGQGTRVNQQQAELDLQRRLTTEFIPRAQAAVGDSWNRLPPQAQAALASVTYNYGSLPASVVAAARSGDVNQIAAAVEGLSGHNNGINANRRQQEAAIIRGGGGAPQGAAPATAAPQAGMGGGQNPQTAQLLAALSSPWASRNPMLAQMAAATLTKQFSRDPIDDQIRRIELAQKQRDLTESKPFTIKVDGEDVSVIRDAQNNIRRVQLAGDPAGGQPRTYQMPDGRVVQLPADPTARKKMLEEFGSTGAKAIEGAPGAITTAQQSLSVVEKLIGSEDGKIKPHPGLPNVFGLYGKIPTRPGSDTADAESFIAQIKDRSFLEGIAAMKGSGAISEAEGTKAAGAVARLNTNQSPKAFEESLKELRGILRTALQRNQTIAAGGRAPSAPPPAQSPAAGENWNNIAPGIRIREL